jgi:hypothetical protein
MHFFRPKHRQTVIPPSFPYLRPKTTHEFARTITRTILGIDTLFHASNPTLVEYKDHYLLNLRWINYQYHENGSKKTIPPIWISLNSRYRLNHALQ